MTTFNVYADGTFWASVEADTAEQAKRIVADKYGTVDVGRTSASTEGMTATVRPVIEFRLSQHDDGYRAADWFDRDLEDAFEADSAERADEILRGAYKGADVDGITVSWVIE